MNKNFSKILMIVTLVLSLIGIILYYLSAEGDKAAMGNYVGYSFLLLIVATGLALLFSIYNMIKKPALLKKTALSLAVMGAVLAVAYFMADGNEVLDASGKVFEGSAGSTSKWVGTFINYSMILLGIGSTMFLYDMIKNLIK